MKKIEQKLNLDIAGAVSELETLMKRVLPRNIFWRIVLGRGLEFDGYRDYNFDDDAVNIDWKASVRGGKTLIRKYIEERDLKFMFFVDVSDNMVFGSTEKLKCEYTAELVSALAHLILVSGDRFGFVLFNDKVARAVMPKMGKRQFEILVHELSNPLVYGGKSDFDKILGGFIETLDKNISMVFLVSDFINMDESYKKNLEILSSMFETVAVIVRDPLDISMPDVNEEIVISNLSDDESLLINPRVAGNLYKRNALEQLELVKEIFKDYGIDFLELMTDKSSSQGIAEFLTARIKSGRKVRVENVY